MQCHGYMVNRSIRHELEKPSSTSTAVNSEFRVKQLQANSPFPGHAKVPQQKSKSVHRRE